MSKLSTLILVAALLFGLSTPASNVFSSGLDATANSSEQLCGNATPVSLLTNPNKGLSAGTVTVANDETTLFVTYTTTSPWTLVKTDLAAAGSLAGIPVTSKGNPKVDQFPYHTSHPKVTTFTYVAFVQPAPKSSWRRQFWNFSAAPFDTSAHENRMARLVTSTRSASLRS